MRATPRTVLQVGIRWRSIVNRVAGRDEDPVAESCIVTERPDGEEVALVVLLPCLSDGTVDPDVVADHNAAAALLNDGTRRHAIPWGPKR